MANIAFGNKYFIFSKFSSIPKTTKIEQDRANLIKEHEKFQAFKKSEELKSFKELGKYLESHEHKGLVERLQKSIATEEGKVKSYEAQKKSKKIKTYFKFKDSQKLKDFTNYKESVELKKYYELNETVTGSGFKSKKSKLEESLKELSTKGKPDQDKELAALKAKTEKQLSDLVKQEKEFNQLAKSKPLKSYFKFKDSQKYKEFVAFEKSQELKDFQALEKLLNSADWKEKFETLKGQLNDENEKIKKHLAFKESKDYKWYASLKDSGHFKELTRWKVVFEDTFNSDKLNTEKWMTRYYWGDKLVNDAYALESDKAFPTDGKNIEFNKTLKIVTRKEKVEGKQWKVPFGFVPQEFEFTTGLVSSAKSFRMKYGKVEAKIKVNFAKPVNYNFWMASENNLPHVDILKLSHKKSRVDVGYAYGDLADSKGPKKISGEFTGLDVSQDFFIYCLEWTKDKLTWKINDVVVHEQKKDIPHEEMYLVFSSGITGKADGSGLPASMEVDWMRCYQEA